MSRQSPEKAAEARLINLRWLSVVAMLAVAQASVWLIGSDALLARLASISLVVGCANVTLLLYTRAPRGRAETAPLLSPFAHLVFDLVAWANFIYFSGGATNPLISVFLPLVAIGAMLLGRLQAWLFGALAIVAYSYLWFFHQPLVVADAGTATRLHILGMWLVFVVSAVVLVWFILQASQSLRERDAALANAREQAIRNDWLVSLGSLAAGAAHELSTPLGTVNVVLDDLLDDSTLPDALRPDLALMKGQLDKCKRALAQLTERAMRVDAAAPAVSALVWLERLVDAWVVLNPDVDVVRRLSSKLGSHMLTSDIAIERGVANFLDNARRAGASLIELSADADADAHALHVTLADNGTGFTPEAWAAYEAGRPSLSESGMGVGLLLARAAVERHGGRIELVPIEPGRGACVKFRLPTLRHENKERP